MATRNKLDRFAEMKTLPNVIEVEFREVFRQDYRLKGRWNKKVFHNDNPIVLELGCGKGEYTVNLARSNLQKNFIGIDIKGARMWKGAKAANNENLTNAVFLRTRIDFITSFFDEDEVEEIWITFPDPQPKKSHKRLTSTRFLNRYQQFLIDSGIIHLKTDNPGLFQYTLDIAGENDLEILFSVDDIYEDDRLVPGDISTIQTFYEEQFLKENRKIKYLAFRLNKSLVLKEPPQ